MRDAKNASSKARESLMKMRVCSDECFSVTVINHPADASGAEMDVKLDLRRRGDMIAESVSPWRIDTSQFSRGESRDSVGVELGFVGACVAV